MTTVAVIGAGVAGLCCARELLNQGFNVTVFEKAHSIGAEACSWYAGGMLAPWCEAESAEPIVIDHGQYAIQWWQEHVEGVQLNGSLVVSPKRDQNELNRFARLTESYQQVDQEKLTELEPDLGSRFTRALWYANEAHLDPRDALQHLAQQIKNEGGEIKLQSTLENDADFDFVIDCTGYAARDQLPELRGVKGEMLIIRSTEFSLSRPVRLLHPRHPIYIVPREDHHFMLGATMLENDERGRFSVMSMLELLSAAYALHPVLGEAEIIETGVDVRPSFANNLPALHRSQNRLYVNGLYRHGFLLAPAMARQVVEVLNDQTRFEGLDQCASF